MHTEKKSASTSVRLSREVREELRKLENELGLTTNEAVGQAVHSLLDELKWKKIGQYYEEHPEIDPEDQAWLDGAARDQAERLRDDR